MAVPTKAALEKWLTNVLDQPECNNDRTARVVAIAALYLGRVLAARQ